MYEFIGVPYTANEYTSIWPEPDGSNVMATQCDIWACIQRLNVSVTNGVPKQTVMDIWNKSTNTGVLVGPYYFTDVPADFNTTAGAVYSFDDQVAIGIGSAMPQNAVVSAVYDMPGGNPNIAYGDGFGRALWKGTQDTQAFMEKLAKSMTNAVRTSAAAAPQTAYAGKTYVNESFVHVRWAWMAYPAAMLLVALAFFGGSVWQSERTRAMPCRAWKDSALVLLTVFLDEKLTKMARGALARPGELARRIGEEKVILENDWGLLALRRQE